MSPSSVPVLQSLADELWSSMSRLALSRDKSRILFTSPDAGAGTSTIAAATAIGLAQNLRIPIGLLELAGNEPSLARALGLRASPGLSDLLDGASTLAECQQTVPGVSGLRVLVAGTSRRFVPGELATQTAKAMLAELTHAHRLVFFDAPPLLDHSVTRLVCQQVDAAVLVVRAGVSCKARAAKTLRMLETAGLPVLGAVVNRFSSDLPFGIGAASER
jgi:Mrp family chromosome partitioning ATPase